MQMKVDCTSHHPVRDGSIDREVHYSRSLYRWRVCHVLPKRRKGRNAFELYLNVIRP